MSALGLLLAAQATALPVGFPGSPVLVDDRTLAAGVDAEVDPALAFSDVSDRGLLVWTAESPGGCAATQVQTFAEWDGASWSAPSPTPGLAAGVWSRHHDLRFRPGHDAALLSYATTLEGQPCFGEMAARTWSAAGGWGPPVLTGDGVDDDDHGGPLLFHPSGAFALRVWQDAVTQPFHQRDLRVDRWDAGTGTWSPSEALHLGPLIELCIPGSGLGHDPVTDRWVAAYLHGAPIGFWQAFDVSVRVADGASPTSFGPAAPLVDDGGAPVADFLPIVSFRADGAGAVFFGRAVGGGDEELVGATWDGAGGFGPPVALTDNGSSEIPISVVAGEGGWHVLLTRQPPGELDRELFYTWFDGAVRSDLVRLTSNEVEDLVPLARADRQGRLFLAWLTTPPGDTFGRDLRVARLAFGRIASAVDGGPFDGSAKGFAGGSLLTLGSAADASAELAGSPLALLLNLPPDSGAAATTAPLGLPAIVDLRVPNAFSTPPGLALVAGDGLGLSGVAGPGLGLGPIAMGGPPVSLAVPAGLLPAGAVVRVQGLFASASAFGLGLVATNELRLVVSGP